jgi:hypothetical protein
MSTSSRPSFLSRRLVVGAALAVAGGVLVAVPTGATAQVSAAPDVVEIETLSGRADLVTGGDALIEVSVPEGTVLTDTRVDVGGRDVTGVFRERDGVLRGLVSGLALGDNVVRAVLPDGRGARLVVKNAPTSGPVFSGPLIEPWTCNAAAVDNKTCERPAAVVFLYKSTNPTRSGLRPYDPANPPSDVATTTTDEGNEVPFIVREETGVTLRDEYKIASLFDPAQEVDPTADNLFFNNKLVLTHGASCDTSYEMGSAPAVRLEDALSRGFAVASHALDNAGHNCNLVTEAESLVVTKELVAERLGPLRYTIGTGCSGGSLVQQQVANAYPGVYQGILPQCSFTDTWSSAQQYVDYVGLRAYLEGPGGVESGIVPGPQYEPVFGHPNPANQISFTTAIPNSGDPSRSCPGVPDEDVYDEDTNPDGVRCSLQDYMVNVFGEDADGKARRPISNVGVQYGLSGLLDGTLLPRQFVALNAGIGGYDLDFNRIDERTSADPIAQDRVYRTGAVNTGVHLDEVAIIDLRGPDPGAFHDVYRTNSMTERLIREHGATEDGKAKNQALWEGPVALLGSTAFVTQGIRAMDEWLTAVEADQRDVPLSQKVIDAKATAEVVDRCTDASGNDRPGMDSCPEVDTQVFSSPRIEAGGGPEEVGRTDDRLDCELQPLDGFDYDGATFAETFSEAEQASLRAAFPAGVCDYSKPGNGFQDATTWLTYQDDAGRVVYGGTPLGDAPRSVPFGPDTAPTGSGAESCDSAPIAAVTDRPQARAVHQLSVDCVLFLTIAKGTTATTYAPLRPVTREQMASFLARALDVAQTPLPTGKAGAFDDIGSSEHRTNIERLAAAGIAKGEGGSYDPSATLTRAQMASFIVRTAEFAEGRPITVSRTDHFGDVPVGDTHERAIATGFEAGLFNGTVAPRPSAPRSGSFAPATTVLRDQMATFLVNLHSRLVG